MTALSLQLIGAIALAAAAVVAALILGAREGWVTPFDSDAQRREIVRYVWGLVVVGVLALVCSVVLL